MLASTDFVCFTVRRSGKSICGALQVTEGQRDKKQQDQEEEQAFSMPNDCIPVSALPF
jgi:hypothetical protein